MNKSQKSIVYGVLAAVAISIVFGTVYAADDIPNLIGNTGFVGIGTLVPTAPLEVAGDIKLSGSLVSDGDICIGNCDNTPPVITLLGDNPMEVSVGAGYTEPGATTDDNSPVTINNSTFVNAVGTYSILYDSADSFGNQADTVTRTVNVIEQSGPNILMHDTFDDNIDGWNYFGPAGYAISHSTEHGGSAHIYGDSFSTIHGMQRTIDTSSVDGTTPLYLSLDFRATSGCSCSATTNARVAIHDGMTGEQLHTISLASGGTTDTAWQSHTTDISSHVRGHDSVTIQLFLADSWSANWNQKNWYDNVIVSDVHPSSIQGYAALSDGVTYEDTYVEDEFTKSTGIIADHIDEHGVDSLPDFAGTLSVSSQEVDTILGMLNVTETTSEMYCGYPESHYDNVIYGTESKDRLSGKRGATNLILGYGGADVIQGGNANDCIYGGAGNDRILGSGGDDTIYGGAGNDDISGNKGADTIDGGDGDDFILGNLGDDSITGAAGDDTCHGNAGDNTVDCETISKKK